MVKKKDLKNSFISSLIQQIFTELFYVCVCVSARGPRKKKVTQAKHIFFFWTHNLCLMVELANK